MQMTIAIHISCKGNTLTVTNSPMQAWAVCYDFIKTEPDVTEIIEVDVYHLEQGYLLESRGFIPRQDEMQTIEKWINENAKG